MAANKAYSQATPAGNSTTSLEEVVVTGSFIPTLPEDAAIPVEVIDFEDLKNLGRPSNVDLVKGLTEVGQSIGELDRQTGYPIDAAAVNLRNLGPRFTTVVFNNRRFPEQYSPAVGRFNNIASIPNAVIGNVEVLKSGGAAIYGADAVAGVVNYITRKDVKGLELSADYRYIEDSDGDYNVDGVWGKKIGDGNLLIGASYQHRSILEREDRDFTQKHYLENPAGWTTYGRPGAYVFQNPVAGVQTNVVSGSLATDRQRSATGTVRDPACQVLGGYAGLSSTGSPICYGNYVGIERLVEESDQYSLFAEFNQAAAGLDFHVEALAYYRELPEASVLTRTGPLTFPVLGSANGTGANAGLYDRIIVSTLPSFTASGVNPAVGVFLNQQFLGSNGATSYSPAQISAITNSANPGRVALLSTLWSVFGAGGNPLGENYDYQKNTTTQYRVSGSVGGSLPEFGGTQFEWEVALTYHYTKDYRFTLDIPTYKLQNALNGFGGAGCTQNPMPGGGGTPGAAGCYFYNPFSSGIPYNLYTGAANTATYVGSGTFTGYDPGRGLQNNLDMIRWLYEPVTLDRRYYNYVVDPIIRGKLGIELPGGPIQMAFGGQYRRQDEHTDVSVNVDRAINPCPRLPNGTPLTAPGLNAAGTAYTVQTSAFTGTSAACTGGMLFSKAATVLGAAGNNHRDEKRHYPVAATFLQFKLPILDVLNADIVGRYEKFYSDVTERDNDVFVPAIAVKWDMTDWVALRTSWGKTFSQVNPPEVLPPVPANGTIATTGGNYTSYNFANVDVQAESGKNFSVGFIFRAGEFNATVDYNAITIQNYTRTLTAANIVTALLAPGELTSNANALINCSSPLLTQNIPGFNNQPYVGLVGGACVQGVRGGAAGSQLNNTSTGATGSAGAGGQLNGGAINFFGGQGQVNAGELISNALDVAMSYRFDNFFGGRFIPSVNATYITKYHFDDFIVAGVKIADGYDGVGYRNSSTGRLGQGVPEYRVGFGLLFSMKDHTINLVGRYIPGVINEDPTDFNSNLSRNANIGPNSGVGCPATAYLTSNLGSYPANAGTAEFGPTCAGYNVATLGGERITSYFNLDLIYRWGVTDNVDLSLNISNLLDTDPVFARNQLAYDSGYGSPLGRTAELSATVKFK